MNIYSVASIKPWKKVLTTLRGIVKSKYIIDTNDIRLPVENKL